MQTRTKHYSELAAVHDRNVSGSRSSLAVKAESWSCISEARDDRAIQRDTGGRRDECTHPLVHYARHSRLLGTLFSESTVRLSGKMERSCNVLILTLFS